MVKSDRRGADELAEALGQLVASTEGERTPPRAAAKVAAAPPPAGVTVMDLTLNLDLIERRKTVRAIPVPEAIECNDEESWTAWDELTALQDRDIAKVSAIAKLKQLIRRKGHAEH